MNFFDTFLSSIVTLIGMALIILIVFVGIFTPEKTNDGNYTDPIKYWLDDKYFNDNF